MTEPVAKNNRGRYDEVIEVAVDVIHRNGYDAASVQQVADGLGMLKGSLYYYIKTKEDLLFAVVEKIHLDSGGIIDHVAECTHLAPLDRLAMYIRSEVVFMLANQKRFTIYYNEFHKLSGDRLEVVMAGRRRHRAFVTSLIQEAQELGYIGPVEDIAVAAHAISGMCAWPHRWWDADVDPAPSQIAPSVANFAIRGLGGLATALDQSLVVDPARGIVEIASL